MELRQLRYFVAIADSGSFTKAAERVYVAQSALSHQLAQLEDVTEVAARVVLVEVCVLEAVAASRDELPA